MLHITDFNEEDYGKYEIVVVGKPNINGYHDRWVEVINDINKCFSEDKLEVFGVRKDNIIYASDGDTHYSYEDLEKLAWTVEQSEED